MKFKRGMTLAETLLVFIIIGTIASITVSSVRPWEKPFKRAYMTMHSAMTNVLYNHMINTNKFPENTTELCKVFVTWLNTANHIEASEAGKHCTDLINNGLDVNSFMATDIPEAFSITETTEDRAIQLSNGTRMWLGGDTNHKPYVTEVNNVVTEFYIVYIDLNGKSAPNTPIYSKEKPSDIVAFAFTDKYSVVPLGWPTVDIRYLQAHYIIPANNEDEDSGFTSEPMTFMEAQRNAFGEQNNNGDDYVVSGNEPMTFDLRENKRHWTTFPTDTEKYAGRTFLPRKCMLLFSPIDESAFEIDLPETIKDACKPEEEETEPVCNVKIFEYH